MAELVHDQRFGEIVGGALLQRLDGSRHRRIPRHDDDLDRLVLPLDLPKERKAVHLGHANVDERGVEEVPLHRFQRLDSAPDTRNMVAPGCEGFSEEHLD